MTLPRRDPGRAGAGEGLGDWQEPLACKGWLPQASGQVVVLARCGSPAGAAASNPPGENVG